ncbi:MAG TPA: glycosyltransferase [Patescibacteria group bacterium]
MTKIAITHDYLIDYGGAEQVLLALHDIYPAAPIFVCIKDKKKMGKFWEKFEKLNVKTSWFQYIPFSSKLISPLRFLLPAIWGSFDLSKFDLIIDSSSWAITRGFKTRKNQIEICYCHTPPRYLYGFDTSRRWKEKWYRKAVDIYAALVNRFMRIYDAKASKKVDYFIANSANTANRIEKYYQRKADVIYPPVEVERIINSKLTPKDGNYFLTGGRMVAAKNFHLVIKACEKAKVNLKIFGSGILEEELRKISGNNIEFLGKLNDEELISYYKGANAFIAAQKDEDFGMTVVEAQAGGTPVIAYKGGGYLESVIESKTGIFFDELTADSIVSAISKLKRVSIKSSECVKNAKRFEKARFEKEIKQYILNHARTS